MTVNVILPVLDDRKQATQHLARMQPILDRPEGTLVVHEIYASIQGESTYAGLPCTFVRLTGCPLRCRWCDTPRAFHAGQPRTIPEILLEVNRHNPSLVEVTGGEPLAHPECGSLLAALADSGRTTLLETSGAISIAGIDPRVIIILDMKCPSSGEVHSNDYNNLDLLKPADEIKFVIGDRDDFDWATCLVTSRKLARNPVLFSSVYGELSYHDLASWIVQSGLPIRCQIPLHKVIWGPDVQGV